MAKDWKVGSRRWNVWLLTPGRHWHFSIGSPWVFFILKPWADRIYSERTNNPPALKFLGCSWRFVKVRR